MSYWNKVKLGAVCEKIGSGATPRGGGGTYISHGISLVRSQNVLDFIFSKDGLAHISEVQAKELENVELNERDVLINITGDSVARVCQIPNQYLPARVNQHVAILRPDKSKLSPEYLMYSLLLSSNKESLLMYASSGATRKAITKGMLQGFEISIPDLPTQTRIAEILSALDDKIELNRHMNQTLEQIAQAQFKKQFADDVDMNNLPKGWRIAKYGEFIDTISHTHKFPKSQIIFLNTGDIFDGKVLHQNYSDVDSLPGQAKKSIRQNDILFTEIRPANKRFAYINFDADDYVVSTKLMVLRAKANIDSLFFYFLLTRNEILTTLQNIAESRSGTFPQITFDQVEELEFVLPDNGMIEDFIKKYLEPFYQMMFNNEREIESLINVRDSLLPKLMSGEINVEQKEAVA